MNRIICGVDVSKDWLDAHVGPAGMTGRFGNDAAGIAELAAFCARQAVELVAMEASGGYERLAVPAAVGAGPALRGAGQCAQRAALRRGDGLPGEDRPDRRRRHRPLCRGQEGPADAAAEPRPATAQGAGFPALPGDRRPRRPTSSAGLRPATPRRSPASMRSSCCSSARNAACPARSPR